MKINRNRTPAYKFTVDMNSEADMKFLQSFRKKFYGTGKYVKLQGRWGKNNPKYFPRKNTAWGYRTSYFVPLSAASHSDVYVYDR